MSPCRILPTGVTFGLCVAVCLLSGAFPASAADSDREDQWQFSIPITYVSSERFDGQNETFVELAGDASFGFAFGYNFNERWFLGFDVTFMDMNFDATVAQDNDEDMVSDDLIVISGSLDSTSFQIVGQFNFLEKSFTPFLRASLGSTYVDSNIPSGPATGICWWHPWWGYICDAWQPTYDDTSFSYGAGVGIHGQLTDRFYLEASANQLWIDFDNADTPDFSGYRLNIGWLF